MISGRSIARHCIAADESALPVLLNIASDATVVIPVTNRVMSASLSCEDSGTGGTQVFRYLSLAHATTHSNPRTDAVGSVTGKMDIQHVKTKL